MDKQEDIWRIDLSGNMSISEAVQNHVERLIRTGVLKPGDKLPGEHSLSRAMGASRTVIREALNGLSVRGLVTASPGRGSFISRLPPHNLKDLVIFETITTEDLNEARLCVETANARLAAHVLKASKRLFGIPDFRYYAIADGIKEILTRSPRRLTPYPRPGPTQLQTPLFET